MLEKNGFLTTTASTPAATGKTTGSSNDAVGNRVKVAGALAAVFVGAVLAL